MTALIFVFALGRLNWKLSICVLTLLGVAALPLYFLNRKIQRKGRGVLENWSLVQSRITNNFRNLVMLRICGLDIVESKSTSQLLDRHYDYAVRSRSLGDLNVAYFQTIGIVTLCAIAFIANLLVGTKGNVVPFLYLLLLFVQQSSWANGTLSSLTFNLPHLECLVQWLSEHTIPPSQVDDYEIERVKPKIVSNLFQPVGWQLRDVSFSYSQKVQPVLSSVDLDIVPGSILLITGASGSGKSTLIQILAGELKPNQGSVTLLHATESYPLMSVRSELSRKIGYVGAESFLFAGTLRENISFGVRPEPTEAELMDALDQAECGFVQELNLGLSHRINEQGAGLSMGQRQRLCLARAFLRRPSVLILDEPTANLDHITEAHLVRSFLALKGKVTLIIASHRPALGAIADYELNLSLLPLRESA